MAHLVENMAYINAKPWHGLGNRLPQNQPLEVWQKAAGMDFEIKETEVLYSVSEGIGLHVKTNPDNKVLFRSDTQAPLSVVSKRYQVVQPKVVLEFYRDLVEAGGFELETAGVLKGGRKLWALASTGQEVLACLYPQDNGATLDCSNDPDMNRLFTRLVDARTVQQDASAMEESAQQQIKERMGEAIWPKNACAGAELIKITGSVKRFWQLGDDELDCFDACRIHAIRQGAVI